ncbi:hypothetical protein EYF80_044915 [Liparis tanakae]|uniref:Uncharacterized protein n=1 Tax=Liparis tanakae TaxID=230148 RepID=A0A4Z2FVH8_9TELE|nr:hypothetical protein EYF80_044915 [Liparis tanakae]
MEACVSQGFKVSSTWKRLHRSSTGAAYTSTITPRGLRFQSDRALCFSGNISHLAGSVACDTLLDVLSVTACPVVRRHV